jgi:hypothetical protein
MSLLGIADEVANFMTLLGNLPGDVVEKSSQRYKKKVFIFHQLPQNS